MQRQQPEEQAHEELRSALQEMLRVDSEGEQRHAVAAAPELKEDPPSGRKQEAASHKRALGLQGSSSAGATGMVKKRSRKKSGTPSYVVRKAEITSLQLQMQLLQAQMERLQSGNQSAEGSQAGPLSLLHTSHHQKQKRSLPQVQAENEFMRRAAHDQELSLARVQSAFNGRMSAHPQMPFQSDIRLGKTWEERHAALLAMKDQKLEDAQQYIAERTRYLEASLPFVESSRFISRSGDLCVRRCDIVPFEGVASVKLVFDALLFYLFNMEISVSEVLGDITVREDDGVRVQGVSQNRLISNVHDDVQVEINTVTFSKFEEANQEHGSGGYGILVADFVDEDELYPYSPNTRLRNDMSAAITVKMEPRKTVNALGEEVEEFVVVLTRAASLNLCRTDLPIPAHVMQGLRGRIEGWCDAMLDTVRGIVDQQARA